MAEKKVETIVFKGVAYRRYPNAKSRTAREYFSPSGSEREKGRGLLHEEIYKDAHGGKKAAGDVHHVNGNSKDNSPKNLKSVDESKHRGYDDPKKVGGKKK